MASARPSMYAAIGLKEGIIYEYRQEAVAIAQVYTRIWERVLCRSVSLDSEVRHVTRVRPLWILQPVVLLAPRAVCLVKIGQSSVNGRCSDAKLNHAERHSAMNCGSSGHRCIQ
jgi:hypothetical protein